MNFYEKKYALRTSDFNRFGHMKAAAVLDLFQSAAAEHSIALGCGADALLKKKLLWVLARVQYEVSAIAREYSTVTVKTWPLAPSHVSFGREYTIRDEDGNVLIRGSSEWAVIHSETRKLMPMQEIYPEGISFLSEENFPGSFGGVPLFPAEGTPYRLTPGFSDIDSNGHVNNTRYAEFVTDAINPERGIAAFSINYRREVMAGEPLSVYRKDADGEILTEGKNQAGEVAFTCKLRLF